MLAGSFLKVKKSRCKSEAGTRENLWPECYLKDKAGCLKDRHLPKLSNERSTRPVSFFVNTTYDKNATAMGGFFDLWPPVAAACTNSGSLLMHLSCEPLTSVQAPLQTPAILPLYSNLNLIQNEIRLDHENRLRICFFLASKEKIPASDGKQGD
jgi:hypothetical protein